MLKVHTLVEFVKDLKGLITEAARGKIAHKLSTLVATTLEGTDDHKRWLYEDHLRFIRHCELTTSKPDMTITRTALSEFCEHWITTNSFRLHNNPKNKERILTPSQNALRVTILEELKSLDNSIK